jgi:hypothetical protein
MLNLVMQPPNSNLCGQACVATVVGVTLEESIAVFRKRGLTRTRQVAEAFWRFGIASFGRLTRITSGTKLPKRCLVKLRWKGWYHSHWIVLWNGHTYDPANGVDVLTPGGYFSAYMELRPPASRRNE